MEKHSSSKAGRANNILFAIQIVCNARSRREERDRLAQEARKKIFAMFSKLTEETLEAKWKELEQTTQLFREAFYSGEDGYRNMRIIDLVWQGVANNKVNIDRDREDNEAYTGGHLQVLQAAGITPDQYETKATEIAEYLKTAPESDWQFDRKIHEESMV